MQEPPPELDLAYYGSVHPDLSGKADDALLEHYLRYGRSEGRTASALATREGLIELTARAGDVLEIGPFTTPCLRGRRVKYFDIMDRKALISRARQIGHPVDRAPKIDFVSEDGDLTVVRGSFDAVFSSHCIEHQPDLVRHLNDIARLLRPGGAYHLIIPDKRYTFDHFIPESTIADVIEAHREGRRAHRLASVIEHRVLVTHNDPARHWAGDHGEPRLAAGADILHGPLQEFEAAGGRYIDVHAWQFTPATVRAVMQQLHELGMTTLRPSRVFETPRPRMEFCAILTRD